MNRPEQELQRAVVQLLSYAAVPGLIWYAVPNGGWRSKVEAAIFAGLGVKPAAIGSPAGISCGLRGRRGVVGHGPRHRGGDRGAAVMGCGPHRRQRPGGMSRVGSDDDFFFP